MTRWVRGRWSPVAILIAIALIAVSVALHRFTPGPAQQRAAFTASGTENVHIGSITVSDPSVTMARQAEFDGEICPENGVFLVFTATYLFTEAGNQPDRGLTVHGKQYLPSACQDDSANDSPVPGERFVTDTVFVIDEATWERTRGTTATVQVAYLDPWYEYLAPRAEVEIVVPSEMAPTWEAQARR